MGHSINSLALSKLLSIVAVHKFKVMQCMHNQWIFSLDEILHEVKFANAGEDIGNKRVWHQRQNIKRQFH